MKNYLLLEFKRGLLSKNFLIAILLNCLCLAIGIYSNYLVLFMQMQKGLVLFYIGYLFTPGGILTVVVPIIVTLPFAASFIEDKENFFLRNVLIRETRIYYLIKKYLITGLLGSLAIALPLLILLLLNVMLLNIGVFPKGNVNLGTGAGPFNEIYQRNQLMYALITIANSAIFGFIYANIGLTISFFIKNKIAAITTPFLLYMLPGFFFIYLHLDRFEPSSTFDFNANSKNTLSIVISEFLFLLTTSLIAGYIKFVKIDKDEI